MTDGNETPRAIGGANGAAYRRLDGERGGGGLASATPRSWWSGRWLRALGNWLSTSTLATGRLYVRRGQVSDPDAQVGAVTATVREPNGATCRVRLGLATFPDEVWEAVVRLMAENVSYAAHLLNGDIPRDVEELFRAAGVSLFPERRNEFDAECSCPEWASSCSHVAAVLVLVGDLLDEDPFLLFRLRGRAQEQILSALRSARATLAHSAEGAQTPGAPALGGVPLEEPLERRIRDYWRMADELDGLQIRVQPPPVDLEVVKLLGDPAFADDEELLRRLAEVYRTVSRRALEIAYEEHEEAGAVDDEEAGEDDEDEGEGG